MIKKPTLFVLLAALVLGGVFYFFDWRHTSDEKPAVDTSKAAFNIQTANLVSLTIAHPSQIGEPAIRLENHNGSWEIIQPVEAPADRTAAQGIADSVTGARVSQTEPGTADRLKAYGLDSPKLSVEFELRDGSKHKLLLGDKDFSGGSVYSVVDGASSVSLLPLSILTGADKTVDNLRDHAVLHMPSGQLASFSLKNSSDELAAIKEDEQWKFTKPASTYADNDRVYALLGTFESSKMDSVASDKPDDLAKYGLSSPAIVFTAADDKGQKATLLVGKKDGDDYFARDFSRPTVFRISSDLYKKLSATYSDLRSHNLVHFVPSDFDHVEVHNAHGTIAFSHKDDDEWTIEEPGAQKGKIVGSAKVLDRFTALKAVELIDHPGADVAAKLVKPAIEVTLSGANGRRVTLRISGPSGEVVYAQTSDGPTVYKLTSHDFDAMNFDPAQLL